MSAKNPLPLLCPADDLVGYIPAGTEVKEEYAVWEAGLFLRRCRIPALAAERIAGSAEHGLMLYVGKAACRLQREIGGRWERGRLTTRAITINPAGEPQSWRWDRPTGWLMLYLRDEVLYQAAASFAKAHASQLELIPRFLVQDGLIAEVMVQLQRALRGDDQAGQLYAEAAAQLLAVHLLRRHCAISYQVKAYRGGIAAVTGANRPVTAGPTPKRR